MTRFSIRGMFCILFVMACNTAGAWGVWGHQHINKGAVMSLPTEMGLFFYDHADFITEEAVVPDIRKYTINDKAEYARHYADLELYNFTTPAAMPQTQADAIAKFGADSVNKFGILPWYIQEMMVKLTKAFKDRNKTEIIFLAADLGHYIGDAHMPLHTSVNHNGQFTGQKGIHAFWESQLPEMFGDKYNLHSREAHYISDISAATWAILQHSHALATTLLADEQAVRSSPFAKDMYRMDHDTIVKNNYGQPIFSDTYAAKYNTQLKGMVEQQMRDAVIATADMWYTAWVNAGKPNLKDLDPATIAERNKTFYAGDMQLWKKGRVEGFKTNNEYIH